MAKDNLIHIKLEYGEALESKKDILSSEAGLLRISQKIEEYKNYRDRELALKFLLYKKLKDVRLNINSLHKILPAVKMPEILKKEEYKGQNKVLGKKTGTKRMPPRDISGDIQSQLSEIENRLNELQNRG